MKRMHALPIDIPLVASGEFNPKNATFKLDTNLRLFENKILMFLIIDEKNENSFSGILNLINLQNKNFYSNCYSSVFPVQTGNSIYESVALYAPYDEDPIEYLYMRSLAGTGDPQPSGTLIIYLYELPIIHKDF